MRYWSHELWRVDGTRAIKLEFRKRGSFTLGLKDPDELERAIKNLLEDSVFWDQCFGISVLGSVF